MKNIRVENLRRPISNTPVVNQFLIQTEDGVYFQSYDTMISFQPTEGKTQLNRDAWDYSRTTGKYRNQVLGESKAETQKKIDSGEYELVDMSW